MRLRINYGMGAEAMAASAGITPCEAHALLRLHRDTYRTFWRWMDDTVTAALLTGTLRSMFERWHPGLANDNESSACQPVAA